MIGDPTNMRDRLRSLIPSGWFELVDAVRDALLGGVGDVLSWIHSFVAYARDQTRIGTSSGFMLDLSAWDFFSSRFLRRKGETDAFFRPRILKEILRPRVTRAAISEALTDLTGRTPAIFEPWNPGDCGAYGAGTFAYGGGQGTAPRITGYGGPLGGYGVGGYAYVIPSGSYGSSPGAGCYGSLEYPNQIFVTAYRAAGSTIGVPDVSGYGCFGGGYGQGRLSYVDGSEVSGAVTDADIYACVAATTAAGTIAWTATES